jgi:2-oxoisovalerate dehydrogenase E2 component (dihydrolipoyl transacylase)
MARYEFKLPDIGEGIAEAEIVAWHVKIGDTIGEDQQIADMMTDKATVEMESPVAGKVLELAGEVGDQIPIGSVLAVIETEGAETAVEAPAPAPESEAERPLGDGSAVPTAEQEQEMPVTAVEQPAAKPAPAPEPRVEPEVAKRESGGAHVLASPAVRARARDLGVDLGEVKTTSDRVRHADLDAYLLYNGGSVSSRGGPGPPHHHYKKQLRQRPNKK